MGGGKAGGGAERGGEGKGTHIPVNTRVVASEPRKPEHQLEVSERGKVKGKVFVMASMNTKVSGEVVGYRPRGGRAAVNELHGNGMRVGKWMQVVFVEKGGVQEAVRGA